MTATALRRPVPTELRLGAVLLALTAVAWALTADRMAGMDAGPGGNLGGLGWFTVSWLVMMTAMMLPAAAPMAVTYGRRAVRAEATGVFVAGYLATWLLAGLVGYTGIEAVRSLDLGLLAWGRRRSLRRGRRDRRRGPLPADCGQGRLPAPVS